MVRAGLFHSSGEVWKEHHNFTLDFLRNPVSSKASLSSKVLEELPALCKALDSTGGADTNPGSVLQFAIANIVCSIAFGKRSDYDDPVFVRLMEHFEETVNFSPGTALVDFFPFLLYIPGDPFKARKVLRNIDGIQGCLRQLLDDAQTKCHPGNASYLIESYFHQWEEKKKKSHTTFSGESIAFAYYRPRVL